MKKIIILFAFFAILALSGCQQQEPVQKNVMEKETSQVSITVKNSNSSESQQSSQQTDQKKNSGGGSVSVVK